MAKDYCNCCGSDYVWNWEEAFDKFGFMDGDGNVNTQEVEDVLQKAGYQTESIQWGLHNVVIISIQKNGEELMPSDGDNITVGYDDPRGYLPEQIIQFLDKELA